MPQNPFGQADPLAGNTGSGSVWGGTGQGTGGFGTGAATAQGGDDYDVVEISEDAPAPAPAPAAVSGRISNGSKGQVSVNLQEMQKREAALAKREQEVRRREAALATRGAAGLDPMMVKNFPPCCPMVHHDIYNDIPDYNKGITTAGFYLFLFTCLSLMFNFVAVLVAVIVASIDDAISAWLMAAIYMILGIPGAWYTWYRSLYRAMMSDGALSFAGFFFFFFTHSGFCIWSAVSPPLVGQDHAHTGWLSAIDLTKMSGGGNKLASIFYFVGAAMWTALSFGSVTFMARVYRKMRGGDITERARQEAYAMGAQMAAQEIQRNASQQVRR